MLKETTQILDAPADLLRTTLNPRYPWKERAEAAHRVDAKLKMLRLMALPGVPGRLTGIPLKNPLEKYQDALWDVLGTAGPELDLDQDAMLSLELAVEVEAANFARRTRIWGKRGRPLSASTLRLPMILRAPTGVDSVAFLELCGQGCSRAEALEELRIRRDAARLFLEGRLDRMPGICDECGQGPDPYLPAGPLQSCPGCRRHIRPSP